MFTVLYPELGLHGDVEAVNGWCHDTSLQKWSQKVQARRLEDALESERQKEKYIDRTSHEIRNPLSAMLQSAESVLSALRSPLETPSGYSSHDQLCGSDRLVGHASFTTESIEAMIDATETIILCSNHQKRIVDDVLTLSKLDSKLLQLAPEPVDPRSLVAETFRMFDAEFNKDGIEPRAVFDPSLDQIGQRKVLLDPSRLQQILINLITNAMKFTKEATIKVIEVSVSLANTRPLEDGVGVSFIAKSEQRSPTSSGPETRTASSETFLLFKVRDTGAGLTEEGMCRLFRRFEQDSARTYGKYGGSGLGLSISKELTELQGGEMGVSSGGSKFLCERYAGMKSSLTFTAGQGSVFAFYIKVSPMKQTAAGSSNTVLPQASSPEHKRKVPLVPAVLSSPLHVLIVEDNEVDQKILAKQLQKAGCIIVIANHGVEALEHLQKTAYLSEPATNGKLPLSCILMDIEMPVMDGLECTRKIRAMEQEGTICGHIPIIAVTANARREQMQVARDNGADFVVTKPFRIPDLLAQMMQLIVTLEGKGTNSTQDVTMQEEP